MRKNIFLLATLQLFLFSAWAQTPASSEIQSHKPISADGEAPDALFELDLGDEQVDMFLLGSWSLSLTGTTGILIQNGNVRFLESFPGLIPGVIFEQTPDVTLSLWMMEHFFLELTYLGDFDDNRFLAGYEGEGFLKQLYFGNKDITMPPFDYLQIPDAGNASLGLQAQVGSENNLNNLLIRFDNNERQSKLFIGKNEVTEERIAPEDFIQGRYFRLPDQNISEIFLYIEDSTGLLEDPGGNRYRRGGIDDAVIDSAEGFIELTENPVGRVLIYYKKGSLSVGDPSLGTYALPGNDGNDNIDPDNPVQFHFGMAPYFNEDMSARKITIEGKESLLLWEPGTFSPFEISSRYLTGAEFPDGAWQYTAMLVYKGTTEEKTAWNTGYTLNDNILRVYRSEKLKDTLWNLYPLPDDKHMLYGRGSRKQPAYPSYEILLQVYTPIADYMLEPDIVPGSVRVLLNGIQISAYEVDYESGSLTFTGAVHSEDRLEVFYKTKEAGINNGDIVLGWGSHLLIDPNNTLKTAIGFQWNGFTGSYTNKPFSRTGSLTASAAYEGDFENLTVTAAAGASVSNPDTTGRLLLSGMESEDLTLSLDEQVWYPGAVPESPALDHADRGKLFYKNYRSYDFLGNESLMPWNWELPAEQDFPYESGNPIGPYNTLDDPAGGSGTSLVMDFNIDKINGWTAVQTSLSGGQGLRDLSSLEGISFQYKAEDVSGEFDIYLQIGEVGEDIDGDGRLDAELTSISGGFEFNDSANNVFLLTGGGPKGLGNGVIDTEDFDGNGFLDKEKTNPVLVSQLHTLPAFPLAPQETSIPWTFAALNIPDNEKPLLKWSGGFRIIVHNTGSAAAGKLFINRLTLHGSGFLKTIINANNDTETLHVKEIPEYFAQSLPETSLHEAFPEVKEIFHSEGEPQRVLEIDWSSFDAGESWELMRYLDKELESLFYNKLVFYLRFPSVSVDLSLSVTDREGRGIRGTLPLTSLHGWQKITFDLDNSQILMGDQSIGTLEVDENHRGLSLLKISGANAASGTLYLDEIHFAESKSLFGAGARLSGELRFPGELLTVGDISIIKDFTLKEEAALVTKGFAPLYTPPEERFKFNSVTTLDAEILYSSLGINLSLAGEENSFTLKGGHTTVIPKAPTAPVILTDSFSLDTSGGDNRGFKENSLTLRINDENSLSGRVKWEQGEALFQQTWQGDLITGGGEGLFTLPLASQWITTYRETPPPGDNYFILWTDSFNRFFPLPGRLPLERKTEGAFSPSLKMENWEINTAAVIQSASREILTDLRDQKSTINYSAAFPVKIFPAAGVELFFEAGYHRSFSILETHSSGGDFAADYKALFGAFTEYPLFYDRLPIFELYSSLIIEDFKQLTGKTKEAQYRPQLNFKFSRNLGSHFIDLLLPSSLEYSMDKNLKKNGPFYSFQNNYTLTGRNQAINLFGKFGAFPLFTFYNIDEFSTSYSMDITTGDQYEMIKNSWTLSNFFSFEGEKESLVTLENNFFYEWTGNATIENKSSLSYQWQLFKKSIELPSIKEKGTLINKEILSLIIRSREAQESYHPFTALLGHESVINFGETGFLKAEISFGLDFETFLNENNINDRIRIAIQGGLEGKIAW